MTRGLMTHLLGAAAALTLAVSPAAAKDHGHKGHGGKHANADTSDRGRHDTPIARADTTRDRRGLPPGLAKRRSLPPGLAKQLRERGELPPGLQKRLVGPQYRRYYSGRDVVIVDTRTNRIVSVIHNAVPR